MSAHLDAQTQATGSTPISMAQLLHKHRDILHDYTKEYRKTRQNVRAARDHAQLLSSVRDDISTFKNGGPSANGMSASDYLLNERSKIDGSHLLADTALEYDCWSNLTLFWKSYLQRHRTDQSILSLSEILGKHMPLRMIWIDNAPLC